MPAELEVARSTVESTYKARDVEGFLDLRFYRPVGFWLAHRFAALRISPTGVTLIGGVFGLIAGHLYFYRDLRLNIIGMALHILANAFDNADGQLARLTNQQTRRGRIIDSVVDHIIFINIYVNLTLRYFLAGASPAVFLLAVAAGASHVLQGAAADYYRNAYLYFTNGRDRVHFDSSSHLVSTFRQLDWREHPWSKIFLSLYLGFTRQQELFSPSLSRLRDTAEQVFPTEIPTWLKKDYRARGQPAFKWWGLLMTNSRMLVLFVLLVFKRPIWFFWMELTLLNLLLFYLLRSQEKMAQSIVRAVDMRRTLVETSR